tara:strand:+ start:4716 stop:5657 length:942 start_codon:yes stop_codon:yes gene_type:complete
MKTPLIVIIITSPFRIGLFPEDSQMLSLVAWGIPICLTLLIVFFIFTEKNKKFSERFEELRTSLGKLLFDVLIMLHILLWIIPFHGILILFGIIFPQLVNKEQREGWKSNRKSRSIFIVVWFVLILICALIPVSNPGSPNGWEEPIIVDDSRVSYWPASSQNVWLLDRDLDSPVVVTILHQRIPATFCPWKVGTSTSWIVETLHIDESRLEETAIRIGLDPDDFRLEKIDSEPNHNYRNSDGSIDITLSVSKRKIITDFPFENTVVGELITVYKVDWGGELWAITITQMGSSSSNDPWAEEIILEWLEFKSSS